MKEGLCEFWCYCKVKLSLRIVIVSFSTMPIATLASVQQEIGNVIKRFRFEEIEAAIIPSFPEISWTNMRSELVKRHRNFTSVNVAEFVKVLITETMLSERDLRDRLSTLYLTDISWHSNRKIWYGYTLIGSNKSTSYLKSREIQNNMRDYFDSLSMKILVKVNVHNGITYVSLTEDRSRSKKVKYQRTTPIFFALFMGQKYFFCTRKYVASDILNAIIKSLGCKDCKRFKLMGRDLRSLSELCWKKKEGAMNSENINKTLEYKDAAPDRKETGIDFTQQKQRKKYAEKCFGENPPTLELIVINGPSTPVSHRDVSTELLDENIRVTWEFRSRNIAGCITRLIERRILVTPAPYYISNIMTLGKNELTLQNE